MKYRIFLCLLLVLASCTSAQNSATSALDTVGTEAGASYNKMRDMFDLGHPHEKKTVAQPRYCYKTFEDFICYYKPVPGEEYRLVGYQEASGRTGYVMPESHVWEDGKVKPGATGARSPAVITTPKVSAVAMAKPATKTTTTTTTSATAADPAPPPAAPQKKLKEVIFDPAELEPKQLVPEKTQ